MSAFVPEEHFDGADNQVHAARLGMWIFLASEVLLFAALFALYAGARAFRPEVFQTGVHESAKLLGSINTAVLLTSSTLVACGVHALRSGARVRAAWLVAATIALGGVFLAIKATEYRAHLAAGLAPGAGDFWTLYFAMTGVHAVHVAAGMTFLGVVLVGIARGRIDEARAHRLELAALFWHLVDVVWIFLWPLFYLA